MRRGWFTLLAAAILAAAAPALAVQAPDEEICLAPSAARDVERQWGISIQSLRLSAAGYMLDFRYRVLDATKAATLFERGAAPQLLDTASGARLVVPRPSKVGTLRSAPQRIQEGRTYYALFANPGRIVKAGNRVSVEIGAFRVDDLVVGG